MNPDTATTQLERKLVLHFRAISARIERIRVSPSHKQLMSRLEVCGEEE